jgi:hypothetical protein
MQIIPTAITWLLRSHPFLLASEVRLPWTRPGGGVGSQVRSRQGDALESLGLGERRRLGPAQVAQDRRDLSAVAGRRQQRRQRHRQGKRRRRRLVLVVAVLGRHPGSLAGSAAAAARESRIKRCRVLAGSNRQGEIRKDRIGWVRVAGLGSSPGLSLLPLDGPRQEGAHLRGGQHQHAEKVPGQAVVQRPGQPVALAPSEQRGAEQRAQQATQRRAGLTWDRPSKACG